MKKILLSILCPVALVFAGPYDIEEFAAQDAGVPDEYISAEFGGELTTADPSSVSDLQEGRLIVRQKFEDPFGASETTYQLYQGQTGDDFSSMTALSAEGVDYDKLVHAKFYEKRGEAASNDVPKVYFDGKSVFAAGLTTLIAFVDGSPVVLKGESSEDATVAAAPVPSEDESDEYCDENDTECEDEEEEDYSSYDVTSSTSEAAQTSNQQYAATDAAEAASSRFGIADEVRFWTAVGLSALAGVAAVVGVVQHMKSNDASDAYDKQDEFVSNVNYAIEDQCGGDENCIANVKNKIMDMDLTNGAEDQITYRQLLDRRKTNKNTMDSYATARNVWFGISAASLTAAVVLFVW